MNKKEKDVYTEEQMQEALEQWVEEADRNMDSEVKEVSTFAEEGLMTMDKGVVIKMRNGQEFQVSVVESTK